MAYELFTRCQGNPILSVEDWPYKANSVFNAAATEIDGKVLLLVRVEDYRGISHLTTAVSDDGINNWKIDSAPTLASDEQNYPEEIWGIEDPRITRIDELGKWMICYTSYSTGGPLVSMAETSDFKTFSRVGVVLPPENKDAALFPVKFDGRWAMLHRPVSSMNNLRANIWLSFSPNLKHWGEHVEIIHARRGGWWDASKIGLCTPPLATEQGWLIIYHGVKSTPSGSIYRLGLVMLDLDDPRKVIRRSSEWVFGPRTNYERDGDVDDVVFPCGWVERDGKLYMYYGAADSCIGLATAELKDVVDYVMNCPAE
ncbi:MAG: hypothetical protein K8R02_01570 [Anaerohalosphaeraceae bacterium]|nr:hypothetical protein [Anaerohalosphaeraceae bacterium]